MRTVRSTLGLHCIVILGSVVAVSVEENMVSLVGSGLQCHSLSAESECMYHIYPTYDEKQHTFGYTGQK